MSIILEGFDNSGKSTLASLFGLPIIHPGPRPKTDEEVVNCIVDQQAQARNRVVQDRVTAISHSAYCLDYHNPKYLFRRAMDLVSTPGVALIYCRPPLEKILDFRKHQAKDHDTVEHLAWLEMNARHIVIRYDAIMSQLNHMVYDYTNPNPSVIQLALEAQLPS